MIDHVHCFLFLIRMQIYVLFLFRFSLYKNISSVMLLFLCFLGASPKSSAQSNDFTLQLSPQAVADFAKSFKLKLAYSDSSDVIPNLNAFIYNLQSQGYLLSNIDRINYQASSRIFSVNIYLGKHYRDVSITQGNIDQKLWDKIQGKSKLTTIKEWLAFRKSLIRNQENSGYPFAAVLLDSISINDSSISAAINFQTGPLIKFDSLLIEGTSEKIKASFLAHHIGWGIGKPYNEQKAKDAIRQLEQLPYLKLKSKPYIQFRYDRAYLKLELLPHKNTQLDGIIGVLLNDVPASNRKPIITGNIDLRLQNPFGKGKTIQFAFQRLRLGAQLFDLQYEHPDLLKTNLTLQANLYSLREDSLFTNLKRSIAIQQQAGWGELAFLASIIDSRLTFSNRQKTVEQLQNFGSNKITAYGLRYNHSLLDNNRLPRKGFDIKTTFLVGNKVIRPSLGQDDSLFDDVYGNIDLKSIQASVQFTANKYWEIGQNSALRSQLQAGKIFSEQLYQNDLFRIGGIKTFRGFNENSFFVSSYAILSLEYRIYVSNQSYFFSFIEQGALKNEVSTFAFKDTPTGLGLGIAIGTKGGLFRLIYSLGNAKNQPISFRQAKIHFGLTSYL